jgi:hypothetical protein
MVAQARAALRSIAAGQDRIARDITVKLQAAEQNILDKMSAPPPQPAAAPARAAAFAAGAAAVILGWSPRHARHCVRALTFG